ncbi:MAG TPA: hypothetical protein VHR45_00465 [Thermoanaerobaculia bacterium]|nr:hypothetical protein [Thermoanaerobaculia bacterium]
MKGVSFVVDEKGERQAVLIDLSEHADLWEDFYDALLAQERAQEPRETLEEVRAELSSQGKLGGDA